MNFPGLVLAVYLLIAVVLLLFLWRWLLRYMTALEIAPEKRVMFAIVATSFIAFFLLMQGNKLNKWRLQQNSLLAQTNTASPRQPGVLPQTKASSETRVPEKPKTDSEQMTEFIQTHYGSLYEKLENLSAEIRRQEQFAQTLLPLQTSNPKQKQLLDTILQSRGIIYQALTRKRAEISQSIRDFWVHYKTGSPQDALDKFNPLTVRLGKSIQETLGDGIGALNKEEKFIGNYMSEAGKQLKNNKLPDISLGIRPYGDQNRRQLMQWLEQNGSIELQGQLGQLVERRGYIGQRLQMINQYLEIYPDLQASLLNTKALWGQANLHNYYAEYRILFAEEILYVLDRLGLSERLSTARKRLDSELTTNLPKITAHVQVSLDKAEEAYSPKTR